MMWRCPLWLHSVFVFANNYFEQYDIILFNTIQDYSVVFFFRAIWVNYNDLTATSLGIMINKGNHPLLWLEFRLVKYYNLPRFNTSQWFTEKEIHHTQPRTLESSVQAPTVELSPVGRLLPTTTWRKHRWLDATLGFSAWLGAGKRWSCYPLVNVSI